MGSLIILFLLFDSIPKLLFERHVVNRIAISAD
jgi:hypothetical protein